MQDFESNPMDEMTEGKSLTDWKNEPSVMTLKRDLQMTEQSHSSAVTSISTWLDNLNITGSAKMKKVRGRSSVQPKTIRKQAEWRYAALSEPFLSTEDLYNIYPTTYEDKLAAEQNQLVLNNQFNTQLNKVKFIDEYIRTDVDEGTVFVRVAWDSEENEVEEEIPEYDYYDADARELMVLQQALHVQQTNPSEFEATAPDEIKKSLEATFKEGSPIIAKFREMVKIKKIVTTKNQPVVDICSYKNLFIDPMCKGDLDKAEFIIYSYETSLDELKKDAKYDNLDNIVMSTASPLSDPDHYISDGVDDSVNFEDKPRQKIVAFEYWGNWDIDGSGVTKPIVATWVGNVMIRLEENPYPDGKHPFVSVQYLPVRNSIYGEPDGALLTDNQDIIGAVTRGMIDLMGRSANAQQGIAMNALDAINKRKYDQGKDFEFNPDVDPARAFHTTKYPEIPNAAPMMLQLQNAEAESLTGVTAFSSGLSGKSLGDTATGVRGVLDAATKRELGILRRLAEGIVQIGRKIIAMNAEFLSEEEVVRVTNDKFVTVRRDDLAGNFDLRLSISTAEADNQKAEELAFMLQTTGQNMGADFLKLILSDIAKLRKMPELARKLEAWEPKPDPMAQRKAQLEMLLLEAQIQEVYANVEDKAAGANLDRAKTITEQAKAINIQADTDIKNLDFVEQESGTKQERELEKHSAQAKANMGLKVLENVLNNNQNAE